MDGEQQESLLLIRLLYILRDKLFFVGERLKLKSLQMKSHFSETRMCREVSLRETPAAEHTELMGQLMAWRSSSTIYESIWQ